MIICFDLSDYESFEAVRDYWLKEIKDETPEDSLHFLCGTKCDLTEYRAVEKSEVEEFADQNKIKYMEVSSKSGENVE